MDVDRQSAIHHMPVRDDEPVGTNDKTGPQGSARSRILQAATGEQPPDEGPEVAAVLRRRQFSRALSRADRLLFDDDRDYAWRNPPNQAGIAACDCAARRGCPPNQQG